MNSSRWIGRAIALLIVTALPLVGCKTTPTESVDLYGVVDADQLTDMPKDRLIALLGNELAWTRLSAATVLAERGPENVAIFIDRLNDDDWRVISAAHEGLLVLLREAKENEEADDSNKVRSAVIDAIPSLKDNLQHDHYYVRIGALKCLGELGPDAAPAGDAICDRTEDEDYLGVVPAAFRTIRQVGPENFDADRLFVVMEHSVKSPNVDARRAAINLIQRLDEPDQRKLIPAMLYALEHQMNDGYTRFHVQAQIARLLQKLDAEGTLPRIIGILKIKGWGESHRVKQFMPLLVKYGPEASEALPFLEDYIAIFKKRKTNSDLIVLIEQAIDAIKNGEPTEGQAQ